MIWRMAFKIASKELKKYWGNKRLVFATFILPGLVIYIVYSALGMIMESQGKSSDYGQLYSVNMPESFRETVIGTGIPLTEAEMSQVEDLKSEIENQSKSVLIVFADNFRFLAENKKKPNVEIYYNSSVTRSVQTYSMVNELLLTYKDTLYPSFTVNAGKSGFDLAKEKDSMGKNVSAILPMLVITLVFSACISVTAEAYAGEKERKTLLKLLITPIKKESIVFGKVISLSALALISGMSSFIGAIFSFPKLYPKLGSGIFDIYSVGHMLLIALDIFSLAVLLVAIMAIISVRADTIKEATTTLSPFGGVAMLIGMTSILQNEPMKESYMYLLPIYNNVQTLYEILVFKFSSIHYIIMIGSNLAITIALSFLVVRMLGNEHIIYS